MDVIRVPLRLVQQHTLKPMTDLLSPPWSIPALLFDACFVCGTLAKECLSTFSHRPGQCSLCALSLAIVKKKTLAIK